LLVTAQTPYIDADYQGVPADRRAAASSLRWCFDAKPLIVPLVLPRRWQCAARESSPASRGEIAFRVVGAARRRCSRLVVRSRLGARAGRESPSGLALPVRPRCAVG